MRIKTFYSHLHFFFRTFSTDTSRPSASKKKRIRNVIKKYIFSGIFRFLFLHISDNFVETADTHFPENTSKIMTFLYIEFLQNLLVVTKKFKKIYIHYKIKLWTFRFSDFEILEFSDCRFSDFRISDFRIFRFLIFRFSDFHIFDNLPHTSNNTNNM